MINNAEKDIYLFSSSLKKSIVQIFINNAILMSTNNISFYGKTNKHFLLSSSTPFYDLSYMDLLYTTVLLFKRSTLCRYVCMMTDVKRCSINFD